MLVLRNCGFKIESSFMTFGNPHVGNPHYSALPIESWGLELGLPNIAPYDVIGNPHYSALPIESWELELGLPNIAYVSHMAHPVTLTSSMTSPSSSIFSYRAPRNAYAVLT